MVTPFSGCNILTVCRSFYSSQGSYNACRPRRRKAFWIVQTGTWHFATFCTSAPYRTASCLRQLVRLDVKGTLRPFHTFPRGSFPVDFTVQWKAFWIVQTGTWHFATFQFNIHGAKNYSAASVPATATAASTISLAAFLDCRPPLTSSSFSISLTLASSIL